MLRLFYFIVGYLKLSITEGSPERFLNLCGSRKIFLWDIQTIPSGYTCNIKKNDFFHIKEIVHKTSVRVVVKEKKGLPFFLRKRKKRFVFLLLCALILIGIVFSQNYVWDISISNNIFFDEQEILSFLNENNVKKGMLKSKVNGEYIEKMIRGAFPNVTWVAAYFNKNTLVIDMNTKNHAEKNSKADEDSVSFQGIAATCNGTITSIITRNGTPFVQKGNHVEQGEILVAGYYDILDNQENFLYKEMVIPDASICICTTDCVDFKIGNTRYEYIETGRNKNIYYISFGKQLYLLNILNCPFENYHCQKISEHKIYSWNNYQIGFGEIKFSETKKQKVTKNNAFSREILTNMIMDYISTLHEKGIQIIMNNGRIKESMDCVKMQCEFTIVGPFYRFVNLDLN